MDIKSFKKVFPFLIKNNIVPFLWGSQGIGKTQTIYQLAKENDMQLVVLHTATQEVGDLIGLLVKDEKTGEVHHARPEWFPTSGRGIIFLDELNRAAPDVLQAMFPFITEGRLHRHVKPEGWHIVAAGNYQSDKFTVTDTSDAAWLSRFCHLDFTPTLEEWIMHAERQEAYTITSFIREQPSMLEYKAKGGGLDTSFIEPDRRSWVEGVAKLEAEETLPLEFRYELYSGLIGPTSAAAFMAWKEKAEKSITLVQIMGKYDGPIRKRVKDLSSNAVEHRFDVLNQPIDELLAKLDVMPDLLTAGESLENIKKYLKDIPIELAMKAFIKMAKITKFYGRKELLNDPSYVMLFCNREEEEK